MKYTNNIPAEVKTCAMNAAVEIAKTQYLSGTISKITEENLIEIAESIIQKYFS
jgi:hypothetical protein